MSYFYPQAVCTLKVRWEDFGQDDAILTKDYTLRVLAKSVTVQINDYTAADTFDCQIDYKSFPFDPRCIRAVGITIHMEDMKKLYNDDGSVAKLEPSVENTVFQGFADEEEISFDDSTRSVMLSGRDFTALLIDSAYTGKALDLGASLDSIINQLLKELPATEEITVDNRTGGALPNLGSFAPDFNPLSRTRGAKKNESYWDVIQDIVGRSGLIAYIELDKLVLTKPRKLFNNEDTYQFIYGRNLKSINFKRKIGRQRGINVLVRSINPENKNEPVLTAKIPAEATNAFVNALGIQKADQTVEKVDSKGKVITETAPFITFNVPDIGSKTQLIAVGEGIFEEIGRQQIEGSIETKDMCISQQQAGSEQYIEFDITKIRVGTPIKIEIESDDLDEITRIKSEQRRVQFLLARCYEEKIARALARTLGKFQTRFYTKSVEFSINNEGFTMNLDFINFIELGNKGL